MTAAAGVNAPLVDRERPASAPVNVMPACLACGSYSVNWLDARLSICTDNNGEVHSCDGYDWRELVLCEVCGFVASGAAVTS